MDSPDPVHLAKPPDAHAHSLVARLCQQACEDYLVRRVGVAMPTAALVRGEENRVRSGRVCGNGHQETTVIGNLVVVGTIKSLEIVIHR